MTKPTLLAALLAATLLTACGGPASTREAAPAGAKAAAPAEGVEARAQRRWDLLVAGKAAEAWEFFSPGYREIKPRETYVADIGVRPVKWTKATVTASDCPEGGPVCDVSVDVSFKVESTIPSVGTMESTSPVVERWIETDGNWYFVPKEVAATERGLR